MPDKCDRLSVLFDEGNQAITDNDTLGGAAQQFGSSVGGAVKETAQEYVEEGAVLGAAAVAGKVACGRLRQACDKALDAGRKIHEKLKTDIRKTRKNTDASLTREKSNLDGTHENTGNANRSVGSSQSSRGTGSDSEPDLRSRIADEEVVTKGPLARGRQAESRVLNDLGLPRNTQKVRTSEGASIPDALTRNRSVEIKDCIGVSCTRQVRIQTDAARASGRAIALCFTDNVSTFNEISEIDYKKAARTMLLDARMKRTNR